MKARLFFIAVQLFAASVFCFGQKTAEDFFKSGSNKFLAKDFSGAIGDYSKAIEKDPALAKAYFFRGQARMEIQAYPEALEDLNQAIQIERELVLRLAKKLEHHL